MTGNRLVLFCGLAAILSPIAWPGQRKEAPCSRYLYGLYNAERKDDNPYRGFVVSRDGKPVRPAANDPDAPSLPGFYEGAQHFEFTSVQISIRKVSFKTTSVSGRAFSFSGQFGCNLSGEVVPEEPYIDGEMTELRNGRVVQKRQLRFWHEIAE